MTSPALIDQHATCQHRSYRLTCDQFEALLDRAERKCELCGRVDVRLRIDHERGGANRVRGLLCAGCNSHLGMVDRGHWEEEPAVAAYRAKVLDLPGPAGGRRSFWCDKELWKQAHRVARRRGDSLAEVLRDALRRYIRRHGE